ncbi:Pinin 1 [Sphaceloma murrayae]|uniref:Pinin 1 n=1 Tax=Sphaceloma murrayae TaxID=2082308 RepID=A0A2K1QLE5_9PEZI|nr:Pinin 1 [Sphaceloma murrayae]
MASTENPSPAPAEASPSLLPTSPSASNPPAESQNSPKRQINGSPTRKRSRSPSAPTVPSASTTEPTPKRQRTIDEKTRTRRLFGSLLSGPRSRLSKRDASNPSHSSPTAPPALKDDPKLSRRLSIEARKRSELAARDSEIAALQAKKLAALMERRRERQRAVEERDREREWEGRVVRAGFLRTKTEPGIYWKPWEMTEEQEEELAKQRDEVRDEIEEERGTWRESRERRRREEEEAMESKEKEMETVGETALDSDERGTAAGENGEKPKGEIADEDVAMDDRPQGGKVAGVGQSGVSNERRSATPSEDEGDNGVDAGEDTVIY